MFELFSRVFLFWCFWFKFKVKVESFKLVILIINYFFFDYKRGFSDSLKCVLIFLWGMVCGKLSSFVFLVIYFIYVLNKVFRFFFLFRKIRYVVSKVVMGL